MKALLLDPPFNVTEVMVTATIPIEKIVDVWIERLQEIKKLKGGEAEMALFITACTIITQANIRAEAVGVESELIIEVDKENISRSTENEPINLN